MSDERHEAARYDFERHEAAKSVPDFLEAEMALLVEDIKRHGLLIPIQVYDDKVLEGWGRYKAAILAGHVFTDSDFVQVKPADVDSHILSMNLVRRQLTKSQRAAMVITWAAKHPTEYEAMAEKVREELEKESDDPVRENDVMGQMAGVSPSTVRRVRRVAEEDGIDALERVLSGAENAIDRSPSATRRRGSQVTRPAEPLEWPPRVSVNTRAPATDEPPLRRLVDVLRSTVGNVQDASLRWTLGEWVGIVQGWLGELAEREDDEEGSDE